MQSICTIIQREYLAVCRSDLFPVTPGRKAELLSKRTVEIAYIVKTGIQRNGYDAVVRADKQRGGIAEPAPHQVFRNGNRSDAAGFGYSARRKPKDEIIYGKSLGLTVVSNGDIKTILRIDCEIESMKKCFTEIVLYKNLPEIEVNINMAKDLVIDPEGMYMALPIEASRGSWYLDKPGCTFKVGTNLPKTCCDYFAFDRGYFSLGDDEAVVINSKDIPLMTIGGLKLWDYTTEIEPHGTTFAWLLNNKWETNFRISCAGFYENRFVITLASPDADVDRILDKNDLNCLTLRN